MCVVHTHEPNREMTCALVRGGSDVANRVQKQLGAALGFECTGLTRRDKYVMLVERVATNICKSINTKCCYF